MQPNHDNALLYNALRFVVVRTELNSKRIGDIWPSQGTCGSFLFDSLLEGKRDGSGFTDSVNTKGERWKEILMFLWKALRPLEGPVVQRAIASI